jgi:hypothetical protein
MFKIASDPKFTHTVTACVPVDGGHENMTFKATFRVVPLEQLGGTDNETQAESLKKVVVHLDDLVDENEQPQPYSDALRDKLIELPFMRYALMQTYIAAVTKTKAGN